MHSVRIHPASHAAMGSNGLPPDRMRIVVFAKAPVAGAVKTRLAPVLGREGAARLHARLVLHALAAAHAARAGAVELWCAPDCSHPFFEGCAGQWPLRLRRQQGASLGERMRHAFDTLEAEGTGAVLIGSDCPALGAAEIAAAATALASCDAVIAPAEDGGYGLIGLSRAIPRLFDGIAWGSATVMADTRERLQASRAAWRELPRTWDVDRPEDYERLCREGLLEGETA